jgi:hypothetical protein
MAYKPIRATATKWHKILGYVGFDAKYINGVELTEFTNKRALLKIKCETCLISKHI